MKRMMGDEYADLKALEARWRAGHDEMFRRERARRLRNRRAAWALITWATFFLAAGALFVAVAALLQTF